MDAGRGEEEKRRRKAAKKWRKLLLKTSLKPIESHTSSQRKCEEKNQFSSIPFPLLCCTTITKSEGVMNDVGNVCIYKRENRH